MATRIIPLQSPADLATAGRLAFSAWQFARAVLWAEQPAGKQEQARALALVKEHLSYPLVTEQSFTIFCERILLAREVQLTEASGYLALPSVWLHPGYNEGYGTTGSQHARLLQQRASVPGYRESYAILCRYYYRYQKEQRRYLFSAGRRKLLRHKAYGLLALLYRAVIYCKFSHH